MGRGIASLMDTLFLMLITAGAMAIIFYAAYHYGSSVNGEITRLRVEFYARQVLRTLSAYTITREGGIPDYLLAYMKEDVYVNRTLKNSQKYLESFLDNALSLLSSDYDYALTIEIDTPNIYYIQGKMYTRAGNKWEKEKFACPLSKAGLAEFTSKIVQLPGVVSSYTIFFFKVKTDSGDRYYPAYVTLYIWPSGSFTGGSPCPS